MAFNEAHWLEAWFQIFGSRKQISPTGESGLRLLAVAELGVQTAHGQM